MIAVTAGKGSPGATTVAFALAAVWAEPVVLAEVDPAGGDLALRLRDPHGRLLTRDLGIVGWAAARTAGQDDGVQAYMQQTSTVAEVVLGPPAAAHASAIGGMWPSIAGVLAVGTGRRPIVDVGRLAADGPQWPVLELAQLVLVVCRANVDSVLHARATLQLLGQRLPATPPLGDAPADVGVVVVADPADTGAVDRVRDALALDGIGDGVVGTLAVDRWAAALMAGEVSARQWTRSPLLRTASELRDAVTARLTERVGVSRPVAEAVAGVAEARP